MVEPFAVVKVKCEAPIFPDTSRLPFNCSTSEYSSVALLLKSPTGGFKLPLKIYRGLLTLKLALNLLPEAKLFHSRLQYSSGSIIC